MKIVHICLCGPMTDGLNYQENLLAKYHKKMGLDVTIITSRYIWDKTGRITITSKTNYTNDDGVKIKRLDIINGDVNSRLKIYKGLSKCLIEECPDILFIHDCQFLDLITIARYLKKNKKVQVYVDNHVDHSNGAHGWLSKNILHKCLWKYCTKKIDPFVKKWYGVLPARVDFLKEMYGLPEDKCELLIMGADDDGVRMANDAEVINNIRQKYGIASDDMLIVSGGKINEYRPETMELMAAVKNCACEKIKLIIFGSVSEKLKELFQHNLNCPNITYIGWLNSKDTYAVIKAADLVCFPGLHSVMWEQTVALGVPGIFRDIDGFHHIDIGGNVIFVKEPTESNLKSEILNLYKKSEKMNLIRNAALNDKRYDFLYSQIAKHSIQN